MATVTKGNKGKGNKAATKGTGKGKGNKPLPNTPAANPNPSTPATANGVARKAVKGTSKTVVASVGVALRAQWQGHSITSVLRWLGLQGYTIAQATGCMQALGLGGVVKTNTIKNQVQSGRRGVALSHFGPPAVLTKAQAAQLTALVPKA